MRAPDPASPYFIDFPGRVRALQAEMAKAGIDVYLGSRLRTLSWLLDTFCPWRSFVVVPAEGPPAAFIFVIDAARVADETWLPEDRVYGFAPMGGQDQIELIAEFIKDLLKGRKGRVGIESGMSNYLPEGNLTHYEFERFRDALGGRRARQRPRPRRPAVAHQGRRHHRPLPRGLADRRRRAPGRLRSPARRRLEGPDRDRDRRPGRPGHAPGRERMGVVVHGRQRDRLGLPDGPHRRRLHAGLPPRAPGRRAAHGRHPRHVHAGPGRPFPQLSHRSGERPAALARPQLHRHRGPDPQDLSGRDQPLRAGRADDRLRREPRLRRLHGPGVRARHRPRWATSGGSG